MAQLSIVTTVFKYWAKNLEKQLIQANIIGTQFMLTAEGKAKAKKVAYVSFVTAIGHND
jgi:hypothetical protein